MVLKEWTEAIVILIIIAVDAIIGIVQEKKAMDAMEALKNMSAPMALCLREGEKSHIPAEDLVVGDVVFIEAGSKMCIRDSYIIIEWLMKTCKGVNIWIKVCLNV